MIDPPKHPIMFVVLYPGLSQLEAGVVTPDGQQRKIQYAWYAREQTDVPPDTWAVSVRAEAELQRTARPDAFPSPVP